MGQDAISDEFVKQHYAGLRTLLQRQIKDSAVAADMLNEALALAIKHVRVGRVSQPERLPGYVYRVALNLYHNHRRAFDNRSDLRADADTIQQVPAAAPSPADAIDPRLLQQVRTIIEELPRRRDREIVTRFYLNEEDKADICAALGLSPLHFDKVIFRARRRMRALLEAKGFDKNDVLAVLLLISVLA